MKVAKTDVIIGIRSLRNIDIVTEGFMFIEVGFERPQPPGLLAVRLNSYKAMYTNNTYLHPEYPSTISENGMRTAVFALRYADQLIDLDTQFRFSLFHIYLADSAAFFTISLYGKAQKTTTMPQKAELPLSSFKRLVKKRYQLNSLLLPNVTCFSEHLSYTFFAHLSSVISWYPVEILDLAQGRIQSILTHKTNNLDQFFAYLISCERSIHADDFINVADPKAKAKKSMHLTTEKLDPRELEPSEPYVHTGNSVHEINSVVFNPCKELLDTFISLSASVPKEDFLSTRYDDTVFDEMDLERSAMKGRLSAVFRRMIDNLAQLKRVVSMQKDELDDALLPILQRATLIFFRIFYLNKLANVRITGLLEDYITKYSDIDDDRINAIYTSECKKYIRFILEASNQSLATAIYENLTTDFEERLSVTVTKNPLEVVSNYTSTSSNISPQKRKHRKSEDQLSDSLHKATPTLRKESTTDNPIESCTSNQVTAMLKYKALQLRDARDARIAQVMTALKGGQSIIPGPALLTKNAAHKNYEKRKSPTRSFHVRQFPDPSTALDHNNPVATIKDSIPEKNRSRSPTATEVAMMKTIKDHMALSKPIQDMVYSTEQSLSPPVSLLSIPSRSSKVKTLLNAIETLRKQSFSMEFIRTQDLTSDVFVYPPICSIISNNYENTKQLLNETGSIFLDKPVREHKTYKDLYVFAHGYRGTFCDLRLMSDCLLQYAIVKGTMQKQWFPKQPCILLSKSYQKYTNRSILELGVMLAEEIKEYIRTRKYNIGCINMIGHSMGCLVIEACLLTSAFSGFIGILNKAVFLNGPFLGITDGNKLVRFGIGFIATNSKETSLKELAGRKLNKKQIESIYSKYPFMSDIPHNKNLLNRFLATPLLEILAEHSNLSCFRSVCLISSPQDGYVDFKSALLLSDTRKRSTEMNRLQLILEKIKHVPTKRLIYDLSVLNPILPGLTRLDRQTGRDAHIVHMSDYNLMHSLVQETFGKDF